MVTKEFIVSTKGEMMKMSELEQHINIETTERIEINPFNGKEIKYTDYVGSVTIIKTGTYVIQDEKDEEMVPEIDKEMRKLLKRAIREKVTQLGFDDLKIGSREFNHEKCVYETPLIHPDDIIIHPAKMADFLKNGVLVLTLNNKKEVKLNE